MKKNRLGQFGMQLALAFGFVLGLVAPAGASVVIHEIMYHPADLEPREVEGDQFVELFNTGPLAEDLADWCLDGVGFCFESSVVLAPGAYLVLTRDAAVFQQTYGFPADAVFDGNLSNSGEELQLTDSVGNLIDRVAYGTNELWPVTPDGEGPSLERIDATVNGDTPRNWAASTAESLHTAGAANAVAAVGLPPWITEVRLAAVEPNLATTITARVDDAELVELVVRLGFDRPVQSPMFDDGRHDDGAAGDGVYGATLPPQPMETLIRYQILAEGPTGQMRSPRLDDTVDYAGTLVEDASLVSALPILRWWIDDDDFLDALERDCNSEEVTTAVLYFDGQLYDGVGVRKRGSFSCVNYPKKNWKFVFPQGHDFLDAELSQVPVDRFNLKGMWGDKTRLRELLATEAYIASGAEASLTNMVRLQKNGAFFGLYMYHEQLDSSWAERTGLDPEGARYKAAKPKADLRPLESPDLELNWEKKSRLWEDFADLRELIDGIDQPDAGQLKNFLLDNIDVPRQLNYMAMGVLVQFMDNSTHNYYLYRDTEGTGRWYMNPWDLEAVLGFPPAPIDRLIADIDRVPGLPNAAPSHPLMGEEEHRYNGSGWNRLIDALHSDTEFRGMYYRRLRTLADELLDSDYFESLLFERGIATLPEHGVDIDTWGQFGARQSLAEAAVEMELDYLVPRRQHLLVTHRVPGELPPAQSLAPEIVITELHYHPVGGKEFEFLELYNPSSTEAVDLSGWSFIGVDLTLPPGTVILPQAYVALVADDPAFRGEYGGGLFLPAQYDGALDNAGESILLLDASGELVDRVDYSDDAPWPTEPDGSGPSLELLDPTLDNNDPVNWNPSSEPGGTPGRASD